MPIVTIHQAVLFVTTANASLRAVPKIFEIINYLGDPQAIIPSASAVRWWILRLGLFALLQALPFANDWIMLIDH